MRIFWTNVVQNPVKHRIMRKNDTLNRKNAPVTLLCAPEVISGHEWSPAVFSITFNRDVLERLKHVRCVQLDDTDRLICNMALSVRS